MTAPPYQELTFFEVTGHFFAVADPSVSGTLNTPIVQSVSGLVTLAPRIPKGKLFYVDNYRVTAAYNALQTVTMIGNPVMGNWQLQSGTDITTSMPFNVTNAALEAALVALPSIGAGNVHVVTGLNPQSYNIQFIGALSAETILPLVATWQNLTDANGYDCEITVVVTSTGSPEIIADTAIALPPLDARIMSGILSTIDYVDTPGIQLTANSPALNFTDDNATCHCPQDLIYDVIFSKVTYNGQDQSLAPFAFLAPVDNTPVCITDPSLNRLAPATTHSGFSSAVVLPQSVPQLSTWRTRSAIRARRAG